MWWIAVGGLVGALTGCGKARCEQIQIDAADQVLAVVGTPPRCDHTQDCTTVHLAASCFDACSMIVHQDQAVLLHAALDEVEDEVCVDFDRCTLIPPPCVPLGPPLCVNERCVEGLPPTERGAALRP